MHKQLIYMSFSVWGVILLLNFVIMVFDWYNAIPSNMILPTTIILTVIEVVAFVIGCLGILLQEK